MGVVLFSRRYLLSQVDISFEESVTNRDEIIFQIIIDIACPSSVNISLQVAFTEELNRAKELQFDIRSIYLEH